MIHYIYKHTAKELNIKHVAEPYFMGHYCKNCDSDLIGYWEISEFGIEEPYYDYDKYTYAKRPQYGKIENIFKTGINPYATDEECRECAKARRVGKDGTRYVNFFENIYNDIISTQWYINQVKKYREEMCDFVQLENCPLCGSKFSCADHDHYCSEYTVVKRDDTSKIILQCEGDRIGRGQTNDYPALMTGYPAYSNDVSISFLEEKNKCKIEPGNKVKTHIGIGTVTDYLFGWNDECQVNYYQCYDSMDVVVTSMVEFMKTFRTNNDDSPTVQYDNFVKLADIAHPSKKDIVGIAESYEKLQDYLKSITTLEGFIYSVSERLKILYDLKSKYDKDSYSVWLYEIYKNKCLIQKLQQEAGILKTKDAADGISLEDFAFELPEKPVECIKPEEPTLKKPRLFNKQKVMMENASLMEVYNREIEKYERDLAEYNQEMVKYTEKLVTLKEKQENEYNLKIQSARKEQEIALQELQKRCDEISEQIKTIESSFEDYLSPQRLALIQINNEITEAENLLKKAYDARNELYAYDIIHPKYRNFVSMASIYEYIETKRCTTLSGHEGAYNIYENEIRLNNIVTQLSQVIESLEQIQRNQYYIYRAISETNQELNALNKSMEQALESLSAISVKVEGIGHTVTQIAETTEVIAYNTEQTAFYAKKNTELTNALGFLVALK